MKHILSLSLTLLLFASCDAPEKGPLGEGGAAVRQPDSVTQTTRRSHSPVANEQISQYIRRMFQDRAGNIWFGTTSDGVARYDGQHLDYFTLANGFASNWVSSIAQDRQGELWFGTGGGVSRFDGTRFTNYTKQHGLPSDQVWCLLADRSGVLWAGTEKGAARFNGQLFEPFPIPAADLSKFPYYTNPEQINWMIQDKSGHIWFASNGGGAYKYDGKTLTSLTEKDGLCNNFVETILEDKAGNIWFGTRYGGLCKYEPGYPAMAGSKAFTTFSQKELHGDGIWTLYQTAEGTIWTSVTRTGLCRYDGVSFTCYDEKDGEGIRVVQSLLEDANGQLWVGTSTGVYKWDGLRFANWTKHDALGR